MQPTDKRIATVEQWQALKGVIDGNIGKARVLTADDYNYPTANPTGVALWLLEPGMYTWSGSLSANIRPSANSNSINYRAAFVTPDGADNDYVTVLQFGSMNSTGSEGNQAQMGNRVRKEDGVLMSRRSLSYAINNTLTSTRDYESLSAAQGKVLKDLIDAIVVPTKTSDLTNDSDFQTSTDVSGAISTATGAIDTKLNSNVITDLTMATDATKVEFTENKKNLSTGVTSTEVDTIPLASTTQAGILNAAGYQSIIDSQDRLDALAGGAVSIANLSANPSQSDLTTAWQTATGETTVFNRASIFDSTNGKNWTYFDNTSAWEVTGTVNQSITINNFSQGTAGLIVGDNTAGKVYAEQDGTGSVYGWDALNTRVTNVESATANIPSVVQTTGASTTDVMSQMATGSMIFNNPALPVAVRIGRNAAATGEGMVAIGGANGSGARVTGTRGIAIGANALSSAGNGLAFGQSSTAGFNGSIALGAGASTTAQGEVNIGLESAAASFQSAAGYNGSAYRLLTGLYDPQNDHDAANKEYVDNLVVTYAALNGTAAPTTATTGTYVGQLYLDTTNDKMYYLASIDDTADPVEYNWTEIGGGPNVVQTTGTSTTDVMSQNAVTSMVFADPASLHRVQIGEQSTSSANNTIAIGAASSATAISCVAIGGQAVARSNYAAVAIGANSLASGQGSIALGRYSSASQKGEMNIGSTDTSYGYNNSNYRLLTGLYDAQSDHDAVNLGQMNAAIAAAGGAEEISAADWSALWQ